jgi:hypothetical protein
VLSHIILFLYERIEKYKKHLSSLPEDGFSSRNCAGCNSKHLYITPSHRYIIRNKTPDPALKIPTSYLISSAFIMSFKHILEEDRPQKWQRITGLLRHRESLMV